MAWSSTSPFIDNWDMSGTASQKITRVSPTVMAAQTSDERYREFASSGVVELVRLVGNAWKPAEPEYNASAYMERPASRATFNGSESLSDVETFSKPDEPDTEAEEDVRTS